MIIFDLDDTLIDTSGFITPYKLRGVLQKISPRELSTAFEELLEMNRFSSTSQEALLQFARKYFFTPEKLREAMEELTAPLPPSFSIPTTPYAKEILAFLHARYRLALVTGGKPSFQLEKLEKAGIDSSIFSKIAIPEDSIKKPHYEALLREFSLSPKEVWVCGDRISLDLAPAFALGLKTIHMRWGRGAGVATEPWIDYSISDLRGLKEIV